MAIKFGTDGWRAIISDEFTFPNVRKVAQAIAYYIKEKEDPKKGIIIGYDSRFLADKFAEEAAKVLLSNGIPCIMMDKDTPTPVVAFTVKDQNAAGAVMITASHNPPEYCGIKFITKTASPAPAEVVKEIEKNISKANEIIKKTGHKLEHLNPFNRYQKHMKEMIDFDVIKKAKLKVVYDPLWGTGRNYFDMMLQEAGCRFEMIHGHRDVLFGGITPEPTGEHLIELKNKVIELKYDVGISSDPDADRFGIIDEKGNFIGANLMISALFAYLVETRGERGLAVRSIATTHMIDAIAKKNKIKIQETPVGFKHIAEIMLKEPVIIGGEESGGISIIEHIPEKDGLLAGLLVCEMIARLNKPLSKILDDVIKKYGTFINKRINLRLSKEAKEAIIKTMSSNPPKLIAGIEVETISTIDGVKLLFTDGSWLLARPSGTEDVVRTYFEGNSDKKVDEMISDFHKYINKSVELS